MRNGRTQPPATRKKFGTIWGELEYVCRKTHYWLHVKNETPAAKRYLGRLERILNSLPENDLAIIREEGLALLHELKGDRDKAIQHRKREIRLVEQLHNEAETGGYDERTKAFMLSGLDDAVLRERKALLRRLEAEPASITRS